MITILVSKKVMKNSNIIMEANCRGLRRWSDVSSRSWRWKGGSWSDNWIKISLSTTIWANFILKRSYLRSRQTKITETLCRVGFCTTSMSEYRMIWTIVVAISFGNFSHHLSHKPSESPGRTALELCKINFCYTMYEMSSLQFHVA